MSTRYLLEQTGGLEGTQRALDAASLDLDGVDARLDALEAQPYTATTPADWSGSPPSTIGEALDRLAAAVGPVP